MTETSLSRVNRFLLCKQHLADDSHVDDVVQIVRDVCGLHATGAATPYLSLFARHANFTRDQLDEELYEKRTLGKIRSVRTTVHVLPKEMIPVAFAATSSIAELASENYAKYLGVTKQQYETESKRIMRILQNCSLATQEIRTALGSELKVSAIVNLMCDQGLLIRGRSARGWKSNIHTYHLFRDFLPDLSLKELEEAEATAKLVRCYLRSFGPATEEDIVWWTGLKKTRIQTALDSLHKETAHISIQELEGDFLMLRSDLKRLKEIGSSEKRTVNLLPALDPYPMGYTKRERYLDPRLRDNVFDRSGNVTLTMMLDGRIVGVWDLAGDKQPCVKFLLFEKADQNVLDEIRFKARRTGRFFFDRDVAPRECDRMTPLTRRTAGGFMSPLKNC